MQQQQQSTTSEFLCATFPHVSKERVARVAHLDLGHALDLLLALDPDDQFAVTDEAPTEPLLHLRVRIPGLNPVNYSQEQRYASAVKLLEECFPGKYLLTYLLAITTMPSKYTLT